ncbi:S8 family serine peptidase [Pontibacter toksunensis]|uniref:S8 family serine peptidase n=1 Tax=Pontibacter toksunensis TaxID=1332631 RepID=A0ABW6BWD6_9BACT
MQGEQPNKKPPIWIDTDFEGEKKYKEILEKSFKENEIIVYFDDNSILQNLDEKIKTVIESFENDSDSKVFNIGKITPYKCDNCDIPVVLFKARNIHTVVNTEGVRGGAVAKPPVVGEEYSLNYFNQNPIGKLKFEPQDCTEQDDVDEEKEELIVAVLDTGFDPKLVDPQYLWKGKEENGASQCYKKINSGWNFVDQDSGEQYGSPDFSDNHRGRHGSIVSQYIINEFRKSPKNRVKIMPLKTHDRKGLGDLFGIICAIHFAIAKGAHIINASWGFYYYYKDPIPYLSNLIKHKLHEEGILFVTAAGNQFKEEEIIARKIYELQYPGEELTDDQLRDIAIHNFYPGHLSSDINSIITVTTTDRESVSPTQNYSNTYADLGVLADNDMKFQVPFAGSRPNELIGGSSFATAIATGVIGSYSPTSMYRPNLTKSEFFNTLSSMPSTGALPTILFKEPDLAQKLIKEGAVTEKNS